jgi:DNA-binding transcriptional MerR regulator
MNMSSYSIKDLEVLSGIKSHTLRIWEQRYNIISPSRTDTNIRQYTDQDLKLILNISLLNEHGFKISKIANMSSDQLHQEVLNITTKDNKYSDQIHLLTLSMLEIDEDQFEKVISGNIKHLGLEKTLIHIIYPFLTKIGVMWQTGSINPGQEHFISNLIRQKLIVAIDGQNNYPKEKAKKFLLFLPEGELHELSLLFTHYIIKSRHHKSIYLGQWVPFIDLVEIHKLHAPDYIVTVITSTPSQNELNEFTTLLSITFKDSKILLSGHQVISQNIPLKDNINILNKIEDLIELIEELPA